MKVKAYRYSVTLPHLRGTVTKRLEYYIPDWEICFSQTEVFKTQSARNQNPAYPLTAVEISEELVSELKNQLNDNESCRLDKKITQDNPVFLDLFVRKKIPGKNQKQYDPDFRRTVTGSVKDSLIFWQSFEVKGNSVLKNAICEYIIFGELPPKVSLQQLEQLAIALDPEEKISLIDSVKAKLNLSDKKIREILDREDIDIVLPYAALSSIGSGIGYFAATKVLDSVHPLAGAAFGAFAGCIAAVICEAYEQNQISTFLKGKETRKGQFLQTIDSEEQSQPQM